MGKGLIFDMDGVLADTESLIARATIDMYRQLYGVELTAADLRPFIGMGAYRYTVGPAEDRGIVIEPERAMEQRYRNFVALLDAGECAPCPGALELVETAWQDGWTLAIATSSPKLKAEDTLRAIGARMDRFAAFVNGDMVTRKKPDPEIYLAALNAIGFGPSECVVVEDAVAGVQAARAAGMKCLAVTGSFAAEELTEADLVVDSLECVTPVLLGELLAR